MSKGFLLVSTRRTPSFFLSFSFLFFFCFQTGLMLLVFLVLLRGGVGEFDGGWRWAFFFFCQSAGNLSIKPDFPTFFFASLCLPVSLFALAPPLISLKNSLPPLSLLSHVPFCSRVRSLGVRI
ncbi:hypothetical protein DFJ73DRAFT_836435, partial [Zopfochytrium polystomum]